MAKTNLPHLPAGPKGPGRFGAYNTHLKWDPTWDKPWRVGDHPDVVVRFEDGGHRFVFWRGTSYIPCWVTDNGKWFTNEFVERRGHQSPNTKGCCEPMSDKQCRYSHVRIIESTPARAVVHWRYIDPETSWGDWVDKYYTIYPDTTTIRKVQVQTSRPDLWMEFHEAIVVNQPGAMPEDSLELDALEVSNMAGETRTYTWNEDGAPPLDEFWDRWDANIMRVNLKAKRVPYSVVPPHTEYGLLITPYRGHAPTSHFNFWNHWPVSQVASDGTVAKTPDRPSHSSLAHFDLLELASARWPAHEEGPQLKTKLMLTGMTTGGAAGLVPIAKSWLYPAEVQASADAGAKSEGFDPAQYAYRFAMNPKKPAAKLSFVLAASEEQAALHPAFVVTGWGDREAKVSVAGKAFAQGTDAAIGHVHTLDGTDLVVRLKCAISNATRITISA